MKRSSEPIKAPDSSDVVTVTPASALQAKLRRLQQLHRQLRRRLDQAK